MRVATWNIRQGGGSRVGGILEFLGSVRPDVCVITEYRNNDAGLRIRDGLGHQGFSVQFAPACGPRLNTLLVASRVEAAPLTPDPLVSSDAHRLIEVSFPDWRMLACYFAQARAKVSLFDFLLGPRASVPRSRALLIGDFNTGRHHLDEEGATFVAADAFERLETRGWVDAWRHVHGGLRDFSWFSHSGGGFRIDHGLLSPSLLPALTGIEYLHEPRRRGLSDHSALVLDLDMNRIRG